MSNREKLLDRFISNIGLIPNVFGKYSDKVIYSARKEKAKRILFHVHGYKNIFDVLEPEIDKGELRNHLKTLMQMYDINEQQQVGAKQEK